MIERIIDFSVRRRWLVLLVTLTAAASGFWSLTKLPIDAVPDVTNVQVQINAFAPTLTPLEIEKQVTVVLETALAGMPGLESTRSFSRNGFAQITVVFADRTNIYFARQLVAERLNDAKASLPPGVEVKMGPVSTGLGEVYCGPSNTKNPARLRRYATGSRAGRVTEAISPRMASASRTISGVPSTFGPCRIGSCGRR